MGVLCLYAVWSVLQHAGNTSVLPWSTLDRRLLLVLVPLCLFNYVVNIGFSRNWGYRPVLLALAILGAAASVAWVVSGSLDSPVLGVPLNAWLVYSYGHLGLAFVLSALLATPGCEMRSIPALWGRVTGRPAPEHHCPVTFIRTIDNWEQRLTQGRE